MAEKKYLGRDCELSTTGITAEGESIDSWIVTRRVLSQIEAALANLDVVVWQRDIRHGYYGSSYSADSFDCLRHWTSGGQCFYADMSHVEVCTVPTLSPRTFAAQGISTLLVAEAARSLAQQVGKTGTLYELAASNADLADPSISFGSHLSMSVSTSLWENLFIDQRHPTIRGFVASVMAAAIPFFGAGYLWPQQNGRTHFSLSARAHHLSQIQTLSTTEKWHRGLLNSRREAHGTEQERLHLIGFDFSVISAALLASFLQCSLAAAEEGFCRLNLCDPVQAMRRWSWNLDLNTGKMPVTATLVDGRELTLPQYARELAETSLRMCESGLITDEVAPEAQEMLPRIIELTCYAEEGSLDRCSAHLDWAAKLLWLVARGGCFEDAAMRLADHDFTNTNPEKGAFWKLWEQGVVDPLVEMSDAVNCIRNAPPESRARARGQLIERFANDISAVDWSYVEMYRDDSHYSSRMRIELPRLEVADRAYFEPIVQSARDVEELWTMLAEPAVEDPDNDDEFPELCGEEAATENDETKENDVTR